MAVSLAEICHGSVLPTRNSPRKRARNAPPFIDLNVRLPEHQPYGLGSEPRNGHMSKRDRRKLKGRVARFLQQYASGRRPGFLNDRSYDREIEEMVKKMTPFALDALLSEEENGESDDEPHDK